MLRQETIANHTTRRSEARVSQTIRTEASAIRLRSCGRDATDLAQQQTDGIHNYCGHLKFHRHFPRKEFWFFVFFKARDEGWEGPVVACGATQTFYEFLEVEVS